MLIPYRFYPEEESMSRLVLDRPTTPGSGRLKYFLDIEKTHRVEGSSRAVRTVHERPIARENMARVRQFIRIEKGWTA